LEYLADEFDKEFFEEMAKYGLQFKQFAEAAKNNAETETSKRAFMAGILYASIEIYREEYGDEKLNSALLSAMAKGPQS